METSSGSIVNRIIGVGTRLDYDQNPVPVYDTYPSYYKKLVSDFALYSVSKFFGIDIEKAMSMPCDQWYYLRKIAKKMAENQPPSVEAQLIELLKVMAVSRQGEEQ